MFSLKKIARKGLISTPGMALHVGHWHVNPDTCISLVPHYVKILTVSTWELKVINRGGGRGGGDGKELKPKSCPRLGDLNINSLNGRINSP